MKVAVLMLSYERYDTLWKVMDRNLNNAGHDYDLFFWDNGSKDPRIENIQFVSQGYPRSFHLNGENIGIARPFNMMMEHWQHEYDAFHFMANDILEPDNWLLDKVRYLQAIPESGMISICPGDTGYPYQEISGRPLYPGDVVGNCMISKQVYQKVGGFREDFGLYGPIDNDYNTRCRLAGFVNYYIPGKSVHLDDGDRNLYGYNKDEAVQRTWPVYVDSIKGYIENPESIYLPPNGGHTFQMEDHV